MRFEFLVAFSVKMAFSWNMKPRCMVEEYQCLVETYFLHLQSIRLCKIKSVGRKSRISVRTVTACAGFEFAVSSKTGASIPPVPLFCHSAALLVSILSN
jgi:hypothetical protein